jgi:hypothetical protein
MRFDSLTRAVLTASILALAIACSGGGDPAGGSAAASTVQSFYDHLNARRYADAKALYTDETRGQIFPDAGAEEGFRNWAVVETHNQSLTEFNIVSETESPDGVMIEFELRFKDGDSSQRRVTVSKENGGWRLGFIG